MAMRHFVGTFRSILRYRLCVQLFSSDCTCSAPMDIYVEFALHCRGDPSCVGFQLRQHMVP